MADRHIKDFLNFLADNPDQEKRFDENPDRVMTEFGLTADQQKIVKHGTLKQIRKIIKGETSSGFDVYMIKMK
jgi:CHASE3 domain sensor protein